MFHKRVKQVAVQTAVAMFFVMSLVGWLCGLPVETCSVRAALGAVALYGVVRIAGQLIVRLLVNAMIDKQIQKQSRLMQG